MFYLTNSDDIKTVIDKLTTYSILWLDTEIADWKTPNPKLSLIQILGKFNDINGENVYLLDVLNKPELATYFIKQIMGNSGIEKVFHNASFDVRYLGGKELVNNVTCTYQIAQKIGKKRLSTTNLKLKTLAVELCNFSQTEIENEQQSDWGKRPLTPKQLKYAKMDVVYLAYVHEKLLTIKGANNMFQNLFAKKKNIDEIKQGYKLSDKYEVIKKIGEGGFGATFLVRDINSNIEKNYVAKAQRLGDDPKKNQYLLDKFKQEAKALQSLGNHGQIPEVYDFFEFQGNFYLIQQYIDGETLEQFLDESDFEIKQAIDIILSLLEIVEFIHEQNIIHRDIKPENIIIRSTGDKKPVLIDFGIIKNVENADLIKTGTIIGTTLYAPLEQGSGKTIFASDLYSLGMVSLGLITKSKTSINELYKLKVKYQKPTNFDVENYQIDFDYFFSHHKEIPESLKPWLQKSLQLLTENRYSKAKNMREDLLKISHQLPIKINLNFSIKLIKLSYECPRLFYLGHQKQVDTNWIKDEHLSEISKYFSQLMIDFVIKFNTNEEFSKVFDPENLDINNLSQEIQTILYKVSFYPFLDQTGSQKAVILQETWQFLTQVIKLWSSVLVNNRKYYQITELIKQTFIRDDSFNNLILYEKEKQALIFIELEFNQSLETEATLAQIALVSHKLSQKLTLKSVNYVVLPSLKTVTYSWPQIEETITKISQEKSEQIQQWLKGKRELIPATNQEQFCHICPQETTCKKMFLSAKKTEIKKPVQFTLSPVEISQKEPINSQEIGENLVKVLNSFGINVNYQGSIIAPSFIRIKLKPELGVKVVSIINKSSDLQVQLGLQSPPLIQPQAGFISVDIPRQNRETAYFEQYLSHQENCQITDSLKIAIGVNLEGKLIEADLTDPNTCHFLIAGTTGSGKSEFLRALLLSLLVRYSYQDLKVILVDPKRVTFPEFEAISWLYHPIIKEEEPAINLMQELVEEMENRYKILEQNKCNNIKTYNQKNSTQKIPHLVCIFDEYADFMAEKKTAQLLETSIKRLGAKARAAGIHLIIATQRPEAKIITPLIRSNLPGRVSLLTKAASESEMMLGSGQKMAAQLLGKGDLLYPNGTTIERLQSLFANNFELK